MSMYKLNKTFVEKIDKHRRRFFWHGKKEKKGYYMVKWSRVCRSKKKGGLGIKNINRQNISLLCKWLWKLETKQGLWQTIVHAKYVKGKPLPVVKIKVNDSPCWKEILKLREIYFAGRRVVLHNGGGCLLWKDSFGPDKVPLMRRFPEIYDICQDQDCTVKFLVNKNFILSFRRQVTGRLLNQWNMVVDYIKGLQLGDACDEIKWSLTKNGIFSTRSVYSFLEKSISGPNCWWIWKARLPLKIQIFMWQAFQDAILTRDNMKKRRWKGNPVCSFCKEHESLNHLFFLCPVARVVWGAMGNIVGTDRCPKNLWQAVVWFYSFFPKMRDLAIVGIASVCWALWKIRNKVTFDDHRMRTPCEVVFHAASLLNYWAGLPKDADKDFLKLGSEKMMMVATDLLRADARRRVASTGMMTRV